MPPPDDFASRLPRTARVAEEGRGGLHPGLQIYVSLQGAIVVDAALGDALPGQPLTSDHAMHWLSAGKPVTAAAVLQQVEAGRLDLESPVARYLPQFAQNGKQSVTLRQLLTHTSGIQPVVTGWPRAAWDDIIERICRAGLRRNSAGTGAAAYDPVRSWFLLGELLQRVTGRPFERVLLEDIRRPLAMDHCGWSLAHSAAADLAGLYVCDGAECRLEPDRLGDVPSPGGSFFGPARELGRFYEMLLDGGRRGDARLLSTDAVAAMTSRQREGEFDLTFQHVVDIGLGVLVDSNRYGAETVPYGFGRHCSPHTFGHGGAECTMAFADPEHGLVVAWATNGRPGEAAHQARNRELCSSIYLDLGLAS